MFPIVPNTTAVSRVMHANISIICAESGSSMKPNIDFTREHVVIRI